MIRLKTEISKYANAFGLTNEKVILLNELENITNGKHKTLIENCRQLLKVGDKIGYSNAKKKLPSLTFSGLFNGAHKKENLIQYSNFIVIDIDNLEPQRVNSIKQFLFKDEFVFSVWISPSGKGLKLLIKINNGFEDHALCFVCISEYFKTSYQIEIDKSGSDVCRLCFVSDDVELLLKDNSTIFDFNNFLHLIEEPAVIKKEKSGSEKQEKKEIIAKISTSSQRALFWATEGKNIGRNRDTMEKIIKNLSKNNKSITGTYNDWFRVALAIANSFTFEVGQTYFLQLCRLDKESHDEYKSQYLLEYCFRNRKLDKVEFSTIVYLAKQNGFII